MPLTDEVDLHKDKRELVLEALQDDGDALVKSIRNYVYRAGIAGHPDTREEIIKEVLQDTVVKALEIIHKFNPQWSALAWLRRIALHIVRHRQRRLWQYEDKHIQLVSDFPVIRAIEQSVGNLTEAEMFDILAGSSSGEDKFSERIVFDELIEPLNERDQSILRLRFIDGLDGPAIADHLGISAGAAYTALSRAISRCEQIYRNSEWMSEGNIGDDE